MRFLDTLPDAGFRVVLDPAIGQKRFQFGRRSGADPAEDIQQVRLHVDIVALAGHRQRIEDGRRLACVFVAEKQPGLFAHDRTFDHGFGPIVVDRDSAVFQKSLEGFPAIAEVVDTNGT
jgi:hypothetical protein